MAFPPSYSDQGEPESGTIHSTPALAPSGANKRLRAPLVIETSTLQVSKCLVLSGSFSPFQVSQIWMAPPGISGHPGVSPAFWISWGWSKCGPPGERGELHLRPGSAVSIGVTWEKSLDPLGPQFSYLPEDLDITCLFFLVFHEDRTQNIENASQTERCFMIVRWPC